MTDIDLDMKNAAFRISRPVETVPFEVAKLSLSPGDILVIRRPRYRFGQENETGISTLLEALRNSGVRNVQVALIEEGVDLSVITPPVYYANPDKLPDALESAAPGKVRLVPA